MRRSTPPFVVLATVVAAIMPCGSASVANAHDLAGSDVPTGASEPSGPVLVHRALEDARATWYAGAYDRAAPGCADYRWTVNADGSLGSLEPVFEGCARDRISMFAHSSECRSAYARMCLEQVAPTKALRRGSSFSVYGVLYRLGTPVSARTVRVERRVLGLQDSFSTWRTAITQATGEIGSLRVSDFALSNTAYRVGVRDDESREWVYSTVPYVTRVHPAVVSARVSAKTVRRQQRFTVGVRTNVPIRSTVWIDYRADGRWVQASRASVDGLREFTIPARIDRTSGRFPLRIRIGAMTAAGSRQYAGASRSLGTIDVRSSWTRVG